MSSINIIELGKDMLNAAGEVVSDNFDDIKLLADDELEGFARRTIKLAKMVEAGDLSAEQAKAILKIRKNALESVLLSISGIGILAAQEAINSAIDVLRESVNKLIPGIDIL